MEIIKKEIKLIENANYNFVILLTSTVKDLGFFDTVPSTYANYYYYFLDDAANGIGLDNLE